MTTVYKAILFLFAVMVGLSQISMMAVFMGSASQDSLSLLQLQSIFLWPNIGLCLIGMFVAFKRYGKSALQQLWSRTPSWLVFAVALLNTMMLMGFWAFFLVREHAAEEVVWMNMIPLITCILSSIGFSVFFALGNNQPQLLSHGQRSQAKVDSLPQN